MERKHSIILKYTTKGFIIGLLIDIINIPFIGGIGALLFYPVMFLLYFLSTKGINFPDFITLEGEESWTFAIYSGFIWILFLSTFFGFLIGLKKSKIIK
jgi:hypothetical protein